MKTVNLVSAFKEISIADSTDKKIASTEVASLQAEFKLCHGL